MPEQVSCIRLSPPGSPGSALYRISPAFSSGGILRPSSHYGSIRNTEDEPVQKTAVPKSGDCSHSHCNQGWPGFRSSDGLTGERRDKPACCRGCKSPTGKEVANPS